MPLFTTLKSFANDYEMPLARALFEVSQRGLLVSRSRLEEYKKYLGDQTKDCLDRASVALGGKAVVGTHWKGKEKDVIKIASPKSVIEALEILKIGIPKTRTASGWKDDTTGAEVLQRIFAKTGNEFVWQVIRHREIQRMQGYANADLLDDVLYSTYKVTGTVSGRRSSSENFLGLGTNGQNLPKHSTMGMLYRRCLVARPGKVFVFCDQKGAEDWIVHGIIADASEGLVTTGIDELQAGINRHRKLAALLFGKPEGEISKESVEYFLGKKTRHAGNYGMRGETFSDSLATKGIHIPANLCDQFLDRFHKTEPQIRAIFQKYVEDELTTRHRLTTPIGRQRDFLSLRSYSDNSKVFRDAYSYIPQSTVGDNTGLSILWIETDRPGLVVADHHDAVGTEVDNDIDTVYDTVQAMEQSFDRFLVFPKGFALKIPVEFEIGYDLGSMETCGNLTKAGLMLTLTSLNQRQKAQGDSIFGPQQRPFQPV